MKKNEKMIAICFALSFLLVITSSIYMLYKNKPNGYVFEIQRVVKRYR